jgi:hypothetical protein
MLPVQKIAVAVGIAFLVVTLLIKTGVLRPGPDTRPMEERQAEVLRVSVSKIRTANEIAEKRLAELQRELEAHLAATLALNAKIPFPMVDGLPVPAPVPTPPPVGVPSAATTRRSTLLAKMSELHERRLTELRSHYEERLRTMGLSGEEIGRVLQIMAEDGSASLLAAVLRDPGNDRPAREELLARLEANRAALLELLGPQGVELLAQYREEARFMDSAVNAVGRIERAGGPLSPGGEEAAMALAHAMFTERVDATLLSGEKSWTGETEVALRAARAALWTQWLNQDGAAVNEDERARIKSWFTLATEERISALGEMAWAAEKRRKETKK